MPISVDLVAASANGLDPEMSAAAAYYQARRIAYQCKLGLKKIHNLSRHNHRLLIELFLS